MLFEMVASLAGIAVALAETETADEVMVEEPAGEDTVKLDETADDTLEVVIEDAKVEVTEVEGDEVVGERREIMTPMSEDKATVTVVEETDGDKEVVVKV
jgi:hypothetical protein